MEANDEPIGCRAHIRRESHCLGADETVLRGRWLLVARVGWIALTALVLPLNAIAIPRADALLQVACQPEPVYISGLTSADLRQLQQSGVTPGFLAAYQIAWMRILGACGRGTHVTVRRLLVASLGCEGVRSWFCATPTSMWLTNICRHELTYPSAGEGPDMDLGLFAQSPAG